MVFKYKHWVLRAETRCGVSELTVANFAQSSTGCFRRPYR
jgi:hypothetical protein